MFHRTGFEQNLTQQAHQVIGQHHRIQGGFSGPEILQVETVGGKVVLEFLRSGSRSRPGPDTGATPHPPANPDRSPALTSATCQSPGHRQTGTASCLWLRRAVRCADGCRSPSAALTRPPAGRRSALAQCRARACRPRRATPTNLVHSSGRAARADSGAER